MLHRDSPDTRALIDRPHVLFEPAATAEGLSGTLFLSTYPIFPEGERWLAGGVNHYFADANDQGWFNVTQLLLDELDTWPAAPIRPMPAPPYIRRILRLTSDSASVSAAARYAGNRPGLEPQ